MSENGTIGKALENRITKLLGFAAIVATAVVFLWQSQDSQNLQITQNDKALAVLSVRLTGIETKLEEVKTAVFDLRKTIAKAEVADGVNDRGVKDGPSVALGIGRNPSSSARD